MMSAADRATTRFSYPQIVFRIAEEVNYGERTSGKQTAPRALETVRHEFDELIDRFFGTKPLSIQRFHALLNEPAIESFIEGDKMVVRAEMAGVDPKDVEVTVSGNMLTIRGKREQQHEEKGRDFLQREISY